MKYIYRLLFILIFILNSNPAFAETRIWNFDNSDEYTTDSRVMVDAGLAKLMTSFQDNSIKGDDLGVSYSTALADFDNDGEVDIYVANDGQNYFFYNNGDGTFTYDEIEGDTSSSLDVEVADFNEDGYLDLYVVNGAFPSVGGLIVIGGPIGSGSGYGNQLLLNNGDRTFTDASFDINEISYDAEVADFNEDGHLDLYVGNQSQNRLWLGDGSGGFTSADIPDDDADNTVGVALGDVNGDGHMDIYEANLIIQSGFPSGSINPDQNNLWLGAGDGTFTPADIPDDDQGASYDAEIADLNGDTFLDIYIANSGQNNLWLGVGDGTFTPADIPNDDQGASYDAEIADLNGDTFLDIYVGNEAQNSLWLGVGDGTFTPADIPDDDQGASYDAEIADLNGDTFLDIYIANSGQNNLWLGDGSGEFINNSIQGDASGLSYSTALADFDNDGEVDIYVANDGQNYFFYNNGDGTFTYDEIEGDTSSSLDVEVADFNEDGYLDLYVVNGNYRVLSGSAPSCSFQGGCSNRLWLSDGLGGFTDGSFDANERSFAAKSADFNEDGHLDLYVGNQSQNRLWLGVGDGTFNSADIIGDNSVPTVGVALGDINSDGHVDIYNANTTTGFLAPGSAQNNLWLGDGSGGFTSADISEDNRGASYDAEIADLNGDTFLDIYVANRSQNDLWLGDGSGGFTSVDIPDNDQGVAYDAEIADLNGDTFLDIYVAYDGQNNLWLNNGLGEFTLSNILVDNEGTESYGVEIADLNDDGNIDIYVANFGQNNLFIGGSYPAYGYIEPITSSYFSSGLTSFSHILGNDNEGIVQYQISNDGGDTWYYWDGSWEETSQTNGTETSTVGIVNNHIDEFEESGDFLWRAYLLSDGSEAVELDSVTIDGNFPSFDISMTTPSEDTTVPNKAWFPVTLRVECTTGDCGDINLTLDPIGTFFFEKSDYGSEEDCITNNVCITRGDSKGIYNSVLEASFDSSNYESPFDTEWAAEACGENPENLDYDYWNNAIFDIGINSVSELPGNPMCVHLITDDLYLDIEFDSWTSGNGQGQGGGGGFSYYRTSVGKGIIPTTPTQPFYTDAPTNPVTITVGEGQTVEYTFNVYADGTLGEEFDFFGFGAYASGGATYVESEQYTITIGEENEEITPTQSSSSTKKSSRRLTQVQIDELFSKTSSSSESETETPKQCDNPLTQNLKAPSRNGVYNSYTGAIVTEAKILQSHLNRLGFQSGPEDGIIGPLTDGAIKRMQSSLNVTPDGYVGPVTRNAINNSCTSYSTTELEAMIKDLQDQIKLL